MNISSWEQPYACLDRFLVFSIENLNVKLGIKLMYSFRIALSFLFVAFLLYHNMNLLMKYRRNQKVDKLTLMAQIFFLCEKFFKLIRDTNFYQLMHH